jgi:hypothetical protein
MPILALGALAGGALGAAGVGGMTLASGAMLGAGIGSALQGSKDAKSAQKDALAAAQAGQVNISSLDAMTREIAKRNAEQSAALEKAMTPEVPELRTAANKAVIAGLQPSSAQNAAADSLFARLGGTVSTPLLQAAIDKAKSDLALGGKLGVDQQNEVARRAIARTGSVTGGLGLGRDVTARDLGLTSYNVEQQRLQNAAGIGGQELQREQFNNTNFLNQFQALQNYYNNNRSFSLGAAQYGQSIAPPIVGLDPSSAANIAVGNQNNAQAAATNAANIKGATAQGMTQLGGQFLGFGLGQMIK